MPSPDLFVAIEQVSADKQASQRSMGLTVRPCPNLLASANHKYAAASYNIDRHTHPTSIHPSPSIKK